MINRSACFSPVEFGAAADGSTLDTAAMQKAIDSAGACGGGTVYVPAGKYLTGSLFFRDNVSLHVEPGAVILGSQDPVDYPVLPYR